MERQDILAQLKKIPAFRDLDAEGERELLRLVPYVREHLYRAGEILLRGEQVPDKTIIILDGRVRLFSVAAPGNERQSLGERSAGAVLGRTDLRIGNFELVTVEAVEDTHVLLLPFRDLIRAYQKSAYLREHLDGPLESSRLISTLKAIPLFQAFTDRAGELELYQVAKITHEQFYAHGEWLFRQGEISDRLFYILSGHVKLTAIDPKGITQNLGILGAGDVAGETGLLIGDFHDVTAVAEGYARVLYLLRSEFLDLLQQRPYLRSRLSASETVEKRRRLRQFDWLRDDEWLVAVVQRHWSRLLRQIGAPVLAVLLLLPVVISLLISGKIALVVIAGFLLLLVIGLISGISWQYINWRDDFFVVTTQRVVHIERAGPFSTQQEETPLDNIQDIYEVQPGPFSNLLNYGNLVLQTAGETVDIDMSYVPHPDELRKLISEQVERARARDILRTRGEIRELLAHRLQGRGTTGVESDNSSGQPSTQSPAGLTPMTILRYIWEYFFPPSWVEVDNGNTIIWRRFWLPGFTRSLLPLLALLALTTGGALFLTKTVGRPSFTGWLAMWLSLEVILSGILLWMVEDWRNDYFQLTPTHIILVERLPLLLRESRHEARLDRIQNLSFEVPSIIARALDYGHVQFETAGTEGRFELHYVRHPEKVQATISNRQYEYRQRQREMEARRRQQELLTWFATYDELHQEINP